MRLGGGSRLREYPHRHEIWGPDSLWTPALATQLFDQTGWFSILTLSDSLLYFEGCYALAVVTCALFMLGWRPRAMSIVFAVVVASFPARAIFMTDGGDNLMLVMALYLCLTACGRRCGAGPSMRAEIGYGSPQKGAQAGRYGSEGPASGAKSLPPAGC